MKYLLSAIIIITAFHARAQHTVDSKEFLVPYESRCPVLYTTDTVTTLAFFKGNLTRYFTKHINWKKLDQVEGIIIVRVLVDTNGRACCYAITNNTLSSNETILNMYIGDLITGMKWRPAMVNKKPVNSIRGIAIYNRVENEEDFTVGYFNLARKFKKFEPRKKIKRTFNDSSPDNTFDKREVIRRSEN